MKFLIAFGFVLIVRRGTAESKDVRQAARKGWNVIYITWNGFRWQEFFGGAQQAFLSKDAGVDKVEFVTNQYWRESESE
jgi:hypothetical protein